VIQQRNHSYEELRTVVVDLLVRRETTRYEVNQFRHLTAGVAEVLARREGTLQQARGYGDPHLSSNDAELVRDVFWDLFRQGFITLGLNDSSDAWPFFRLSHLGGQTLATQSPFRFHDTSSFLNIVSREAPDISAEAKVYLDEAVAAYFADCLLASCVMVGGAAEAEFLRLVDVAANSPTYGPTFAPVVQPIFIRQKITRFQECLKPLLDARRLPREAVEDLETNFNMIQSVLRIARNEAGHPTSTQLQREQVYVYLQLFVPFARQVMRLRNALR
jgi:hypothetical protein